MHFCVAGDNLGNGVRLRKRCPSHTEHRYDQALEVPICKLLHASLSPPALVNAAHPGASLAQQLCGNTVHHHQI